MGMSLCGVLGMRQAQNHCVICKYDGRVQPHAGHPHQVMNQKWYLIPCMHVVHKPCVEKLFESGVGRQCYATLNEDAITCPACFHLAHDVKPYTDQQAQNANHSPTYFENTKFNQLVRAKAINEMKGKNDRLAQYGNDVYKMQRLLIDHEVPGEDYFVENNPGEDKQLAAAKAILELRYSIEITKEEYAHIPQVSKRAKLVNDVVHYYKHALPTVYGPSGPTSVDLYDSLYGHESDNALDTADADAMLTDEEI